ncbi:DUF6414 family protein [Roseateles sp. DB2]|uniref:DUF6414 family protein n=1 Tax=Roseateles sp. DB2 TaxID=3453717 RepID=UPI003EEFD0BD
MIRSILYLDENKMYSMSSQIFEGLTEYVLKEVAATREDAEEQKGPVGSGRVMADAMKLTERSVEKRFLHDHSLALFETRLAELDLVQHVDSPVAEGLVISKSFVRASARANFIDAAKITSMLGSFNEIGEALAHVTKYSDIEAARQEIQTIKDSAKDKARLAEFRKLEKKLTDTAEIAKQVGLYQDPKFLKHLALVTEFGFSDQLEIQQRIGERLFSACLKRECLREPEDLIIRKYSRKTEQSLVVLGVVTQSRQATEVIDDQVVPENMSMKEAVTNMVNHIAAIEGSLAGKTSYEVVIDPIAVYVTL